MVHSDTWFEGRSPDLFALSWDLDKRILSLWLSFWSQIMNLLKSALAFLCLPFAHHHPYTCFRWTLFSGVAGPMSGRLLKMCFVTYLGCFSQHLYTTHRPGTVAQCLPRGIKHNLGPQLYISLEFGSPLKTSGWVDVGRKQSGLEQSQVKRHLCLYQAQANVAARPSEPVRGDRAEPS